jgi:hypothetical protein
MISPWLSARHLAHSAPIQPNITVEASFKFLKTIDIKWKPWEVQLHPYPTVNSIVAGWKIDRPQISHFLFLDFFSGFVLRD